MFRASSTFDGMFAIAIELFFVTLLWGSYPLTAFKRSLPLPWTLQAALCCHRLSVVA